MRKKKRERAREREGEKEREYFNVSNGYKISEYKERIQRKEYYIVG